MIGLSILIGVCVTVVTVKAQSPADVGGPGSLGDGPGGDGGPVVSFDGRMSLIFAATSIAYATKKIRGINALKTFLVYIVWY